MQGTKSEAVGATRGRGVHRVGFSSCGLRGVTCAILVAPCLRFARAFCCNNGLASVAPLPLPSWSSRFTFPMLYLNDLMQEGQKQRGVQKGGSVRGVCRRRGPLRGILTF